MSIREVKNNKVYVILPKDNDFYGLDEFVDILDMKYNSIHHYFDKGVLESESGKRFYEAFQDYDEIYRDVKSPALISLNNDLLLSMVKVKRAYLAYKGLSADDKIALSEI